MDSHKIQADFLARASSFPLGSLMDCLSNVYFFVKDSEGRFVFVNKAAIERCNCSSEDEVVGYSDHDFFSNHLTEQYIKDDHHVLETGEPIINKLEYAPNRYGLIECFLTSKHVICDKVGKSIGVVGLSQKVLSAESQMTSFGVFETVITYIKNNYHKNIHIAELAEMVQMKQTVFCRRFQRSFEIAPKKYLTKTRIEMACHRLRSSDDSLTKIALSVGFYDNSTFTRQFIQNVKITPSAYRKQSQSVGDIRSS